LPVNGNSYLLNLPLKGKRRLFTSAITLLLALFYSFSFSGCAPYRVKEERPPLVDAPPSYSVQTEGEAVRHEKWWLALKDPILDEFITRALEGSFTLKQAYARMEQAAAVKLKEGAALGPQLTGELSRTMRWDKDGRLDDLDSLKMSLAWEVDLWKRLSSAQKAAALESEATIDDMEGAALLLSARVADTYCQIIEQKMQLSLLSGQIETNETFLELIKLRFSYGDASLVDIYQQRQQLAAVRTQLPLARARLSALSNRFYLLLGIAPSGREPDSAAELPALPGLPDPGIPADLLLNRPDLKLQHKRLIAADHRVAQAVADRLPKINLGGIAGIQGDSLSADNRSYSLFGEIAGPIVDWGRRRAEVERQKAVVREELARYSHAYLTAIEETENALRQEREQLLLIEALKEQLEIAGKTLAETRRRYMQGISDYLPVLAALQTRQRVERDVILSRRELISNRILLYRALGGADFTDSLPLSLSKKGKGG